MAKYLDKNGLQYFFEKTKTYVTPQMFGAVCDGITDDSVAFQAAINTGNIVYVPDGTYLVHDVTCERNVKIVGERNSVITPVYEDGIAQNIFTFENFGEAIIEGITFRGTNHGVTNMDVMRQSAVEAINLDLLYLKDVVFDTIDDSAVQWEYYFRDRKGIALTAHDVSHVLLENVHYNAMGSDEVNWITNQTIKTVEDISVDIIGCSSSNMTRLSLFDIIANTINIERFRSDSSDFYGERSSTARYSVMNLFGNNVIVKDSEFYATCNDVIDTYEGGSYFSEHVFIDNCTFEGYKQCAIWSVAKEITISNCVDKGRLLILSENRVATIPAVIDCMADGAYTSYIPTDIFRIENCKHKTVLPDPNPDNMMGFHAFVADLNGTFIYKNNHVDQSGAKGNAIFTNHVNDLIVDGNSFTNVGYSTSSSVVKAFVEVSAATKHVQFINNVADEGSIGAILANDVEHVLINGNKVENGTDPIVTNVEQKNSVDVLKTDTNNILVYADNYSSAKGDYVEATWKAGSSSANGTELTNRITLIPGVYLLICDLPYASTSSIVAFKNCTTSSNFSTMASFTAYGVISTAISLASSTEICLVSAASASVTFTNYTNCRLRAVPLKI